MRCPNKGVPSCAGPVVLSTPAQLVAPVVVARGTLSITTTEIYFEVDEDDPAFKKIDAKVKAPCCCYYFNFLFSFIFPCRAAPCFSISLLETGGCGGEEGWGG